MLDIAKECFHGIRDACAIEGISRNGRMTILNTMENAIFAYLLYFYPRHLDTILIAALIILEKMCKHSNDAHNKNRRQLLYTKSFLIRDSI